MFYWLRITIIIVFSIFALLAQAQNSDDFAEDEIDCEKDTPIVTIDVRRCMDLSYIKADKELNDVYRKLIDTYKENLEEAKARDPNDYDDEQGSFEYLRQSQRDWIKFRDSSCRFDASHLSGGTWEPIVYLGCLTALTEQQTERLKLFLREE